MNIEAFIGVAIGDRKRIAGQFLAPGRVDGFKLLLKKGVGFDVVGENIGYNKANLHSVEAMARVVRTDDGDLLAFINNIYPVRTANFYHFSSELFVVLDQDNRIVDYNDHFYGKFYIPMGRVSTFHNRPIQDFMEEEDWRRCLERQDAARRAMENSLANTQGEWSLDYQDSFAEGPAPSWDFDPEGKWAPGKGTLTGGSKDGFSWAILKRPYRPDQVDLKLEFSVLCRKKFHFHAILSGQGRHFGYSPDENGYLVGVNGKEARIKKDSVPMFTRECEGFGTGQWRRVVAEKSGGRLSLHVDGKPVVDGYDLQPVMEPHQDACGLCCGFDTEFRDFKVWSRPSGLDVRDIPGHIFDVRFRFFPEEVYEVRFSPAVYSGGHPVKIMHLRNITRLRSAQSALEKAGRAHRTLMSRHNELKRMLSGEEGAPLIGSGDALAKVRAIVEEVADADVNVLITGETGSGKDVVARLIHASGGRSEEPFVKVDCASLPPQLLETELFGHEKGAFTGAVAAKMGRFESAGRGTVFLDEISNLDPVLQAKLLRFIQDRRFERVGGTETRTSEARILSASNENMDELIRLGRFRQDLFYRINAIVIHLPPLRERVEDIPDLIRYFIEQYCVQNKRPVPKIHPRAMTLLCRHPWPGNVRELRNTLLSLLLLGDGKEIVQSNLPETIRSREAATKSALSGAYRLPRLLSPEEVREAIADSRGNLSLAAVKLNIGRQSLYRLVEKHGLMEERLKKAGEGIGPNRERILEMAGQSGSVGVKDLVRALSRSRKSVQREIAGLLASGRLVRTGHGPLTRYSSPAGD